MKHKIKISAHHTGFHVTQKADSGDGDVILADHRRYADALAAAHLLARDLGTTVEAQPGDEIGGAQ